MYRKELAKETTIENQERELLFLKYYLLEAERGSDFDTEIYGVCLEQHKERNGVYILDDSDTIEALTSDKQTALELIETLYIHHVFPQHLVELADFITGDLEE